jgi:hypothetical protein
VPNSGSSEQLVGNRSYNVALGSCMLLLSVSLINVLLNGFAFTLLPTPVLFSTSSRVVDPDNAKRPPIYQVRTETDRAIPL